MTRNKPWFKKNAPRVAGAPTRPFCTECGQPADEWDATHSLCHDCLARGTQVPPAGE